jgi:type IX secretion system PorP/SprF family membrane protein
MNNLKIYTRFIVLMCACWLFAKTSQAQDVHFSQYQASPLTLNPALTGGFKGDWRLMNIYRGQWRTIDRAFVTNALGFDKKFRYPSTTVNAGIVYVYDRAGLVRLASDKLLVSGAITKVLAKNEFTLGLQLGLVSKRVDISALSFPDQFNNDTGYFDNTLITDEQNIGSGVFYADVNAGIRWKRRFGPLEPWLAYGVFHLNKPNETFVNNEDKQRLAMRHNVNVALRLWVGDRLFFTPEIMANFHNEASEVLIGGDVTYLPKWNPTGVQALFAGASIRNDNNAARDAIIAVVGAEVKNLRVGLSYDMNVSGLNTATGGEGAYELSLIYIGRLIPPDKVQIPCERY